MSSTEQSATWQEIDGKWVYAIGEKLLFRIEEKINYGSVPLFAIEQCIKGMWIQVTTDVRYRQVYRKTLEAAKLWCENKLRESIKP